MRTLATLLAFLMVLVDLPVQAATTPEEDKIEQLYQRGQAKYDDQDWEAAAVLWGEALNLMEENEQNSGNRSMLASNALDAYMEAYRDSRDPRFLQDAIALIDQYIESLGGGEPSQAVQDAANRIRETYAKSVERSVDQENTNSSEASGGTFVESDASRPLETQGQDNMRSDRSRKTAIGLIVSGTISGILGLGSSSLIAVGAIKGKQAKADYDSAKVHANSNEDPQLQEISERGNDANNLLITGAVLAPVLVIAGSTMLGIGLAERRRNLAIVPTWNRGMVGLSFQGRF